ncbi:MAG: hypothetical protein IPL22_15415 [Bacteroidetes bacterium]|nr:hypothetical protein [Bacteroidota bacterium]
MKSYWNILDAFNKPKLKISYEEATDELEKLLISSFNYRMIADVPVGVFLSGGYDSSGVTAMIQKNQTQKLKTFTIGFENELFNESHFAKVFQITWEPIITNICAVKKKLQKLFRIYLMYMMNHLPMVARFPIF